MTEKEKMVGYNIVFQALVNKVDHMADGLGSPLSHYPRLYDALNKTMHYIYVNMDEANPLHIELGVESGDLLNLRTKHSIGYSIAMFFKDGDALLIDEYFNGDVIEGIHVSFDDMRLNQAGRFLMDRH
jgi:hypothetical protein